MSEVSSWATTVAGNAIAFDDIDNRDGRPRAQVKQNIKAIMAAVRRMSDNTPAGQIPATRTAMAALPAVTGAITYLSEGARSGLFVCKAGATPSGDTLQGLYVASGTSGYYWERLWDKINGKPEWFGAVTGGADTLAALTACSTLCPVTLLEMDDYYISDTWKILTNWRRVRGCGVVSYARGEGTRLILTSGSITRALQIGPDIDPGGNPQVTYLKGVDVSGLSVLRSATLVPNLTVDLAPAGVWMQFTFMCHVENVASWENSIGFRLYGNVASKLTRCWSFRSAAATTIVNDVCYGYYFIGDPPIFTGGNASLTLQDCKANCAMATLPTLASGFRLQGSFADIYLLHPETTSYRIGLQVSGNGGGGGVSSNVNLHCIGGVFDQPVFAGVQVENLNATSMVSITDIFSGIPGTGFAAIYFNNCLGRNLVSGGQVVGVAGAADPLGIYMKDSRGIKIADTLVTNFERPVLIENSQNFDVQPVLNNQAVALSGTPGAVSILTSSRGYVAPMIAGSAAVFARGVDLAAAGCSLIEVNCSKIDAAAMVGGSANKLVHNGVQIIATGAFGTNCLASGVMA